MKFYAIDRVIYGFTRTIFVFSPTPFFLDKKEKLRHEFRKISEGLVMNVCTEKKKIGQFLLKLIQYSA